MLNERDFQKCAKNILKNGQSVLIVAPTGLGKTRAALTPFFESQAHGGLLGTRLIYSLPLRALARGVEDECKSIGINSVTHHGDEPESEFFSERAIITTIDQYLTAFAGAPLSWASHLSHAAAGAVLTSYSVFDEVHLLSPQKGLQLLFAMLRLRRRWGLLSCVMTATLPPSVIDFFREYCGLVKIGASPEDVKERDSWRDVYLELVGNQGRNNSFSWEEKDEYGLAQYVKEKWDNWARLGINSTDNVKKIIVFVNTVDRALKVYEKLKALFGSNSAPRILLAHSRFTKDHRKTIENSLQEYFGKGSKQEPAILVTTQVAEAGLNISAPLVITELCPMDSLIQRAGRCQRFKPDGDMKAIGKVLVVKPAGDKWFAPYSDRVRLVRLSKDKKGNDKRETSKYFPTIEFSRIFLEVEVGAGSLLMDWVKEQKLIQNALDPLYRAYLSGMAEVEFAKGDEPFETLYRKHKGKGEEQEEAMESETEEES